MNFLVSEHRNEADSQISAIGAFRLKRILVADDDARVRAALAGLLESEGYVVEEAHNGIEAVTRAIEHSPDLVLLDLHMPLWGGWRAFVSLDRLKPTLPVIIITARPDQYETAVRLGADGFMEKPLDPPVLLRAIKGLVHERPQDRLRRIIDPAFVTRRLGGGDDNLCRSHPAR